jgi:Uma2 family endonuclease
MAIRSRPLTYTDLQRVRETRDERLELIEGEIIVTPSPSPMHQRVSRRLHRLLEQAIIDTGLGEFFSAPLDIHLAPLTVLQPDLVVLLRDRANFVTQSNVVGPPSLVIEIVSPSTHHYDLVVKRDLYAHYGVPEYWLVDPEQSTVTIYTDPQDGRYRGEYATKDVAVSVTIPSLSAELAELFDPAPGK